jgi:hypothetical protein
VRPLAVDDEVDGRTSERTGREGPPVELLDRRTADNGFKGDLMIHGILGIQR